MRAIVKASVVIDAPAGRVFEYVSDIDRQLLWVTGMTYASIHGKLTAGALYESRNSALGHEIMSQARVMRVIPERLIEIESLAPVVEAIVQYSLGKQDGGTAVECMLTVQSRHPVFGLAIPLMESLAQTRIESDLRNLKVLCEADS